MRAAAAIAPVIERARDGSTWNGVLDAELLEAVYRWNLGPLLYRALRATGAWAGQSKDMRDALSRIAAEAAIADRLRVDADRSVIAALTDAGVAPLLFKGAALAHRCYPDSWLRPRVDTDLLIRERDQETAASVLEQLGFRRAARPTGGHVTHQFTYFAMANAVRTDYDVHWKIADPQVFADVVAYDELAREAVPIPALGPGARAIGDVHALIVACTHRVAHHFDTDDLLFLYDIDVLARRFDEDEWDRMAMLASEKRMRAVCARGLALSQQRFSTPVPARVMATLTAAAAEEPSAAYLAGGLRRVDILRSDLESLPGWRARARLLREHLLPSPAYMRASYGRESTLLLPALYAHRIVRGALKWFRPLNQKPDMTPDHPFRPSGRIRASLYGVVWRCGDLFYRAGNACGYVAAGLLRREDLRRASYRQFEHYWTSDDDVDFGLTPFERRLFAAWLRPSDRVLLIGSGAGRDLVGLRRLGYDVTGLEQVPELVDRSRRNLARHGLTAPVVHGFVETAPLANYDAVVWSDFCYGCVHPSQTRIATLARLRDCLAPDGRMLIGYMTFASQMRASEWLARIAARLAGADWQPEPGDAIARDPLALGVLRLLHHFRSGEIEHECAAAGLRIVGEEIGSARTRYVIVEVDRGAT